MFTTDKKAIMVKIGNFNLEWTDESLKNVIFSKRVAENICSRLMQRSCWKTRQMLSKNVLDLFLNYFSHKSMSAKVWNKNFYFIDEVCCGATSFQFFFAQKDKNQFPKFNTTRVKWDEPKVTLNNYCVASRKKIKKIKSSRSLWDLLIIINY